MEVIELRRTSSGLQFHLPGFDMLKLLSNILLRGKEPAKERRRLPRPGPCPGVGASIVRRNMVMKVSEPISPEFWDWLVLVGWREVRMSKNKRRYHHVPSGTFIRLAHVAAEERESIYRTMLGLTTKTST